MRIAILVDLELKKESGGHVKYWLRICEVLRKLNLGLVIKVFFLGNKNESLLVNENIFHVIKKPILSSKILKIIGVDADPTDLFFFNPSLFFELKDFDLIHTTDQFFTMSRTARLASWFWKIPLTTSLHTDTPPYTKYYVKKIIQKVFSKIFNLDKFLIEKLMLPNFFEKKMYKRMVNYIKSVDHAMVADKIYSPTSLIKQSNNKNISKLNRGVDKKIFYIKSENRKEVLSKFNVDEKDKVIFFTGRVHELKGAKLLARTHNELLKLGYSVTTLMAGEKIHGKECLKIAPRKLKLLGYLDQKEIARLYRVCDLFIFPSKFEIGPNVVLEAKACGAVCLVSPSGGGKRIYFPGKDGILVKDYCIKQWTKVIDELFKENSKIRLIKSFLKKQENLSWEDVFKEDLYYYWKKNIEKK